MTGSNAETCLSDEQIVALLSEESPVRGERAIRTHLRRCRSCSERLAAHPARRSTRADEDSDPRASHLAGDALTDVDNLTEIAPGYRLVRRLHRGGQGIVYEAEQVKPQRRVAIKVLASGAFASRTEQHRFRREIELVATLDHPNIVPLLDSGVSEDSRWFAMPLVEGLPLDRYLRDRQLGWRELIDLFHPICDAIRHAHAKGVIHRDLKPANVLVDPAGHPRVVDFGLAKGLADESHLTQVGAFAGTVTHASPEQVRGDAQAIDTRTDVHGLCTVLHQMLTGVPPFASEEGIHALLQAVLTSEAVPPSTHRPELPADLDAIVLKGLAKNGEDRYPTVDALQDDLRRLIDGEPVRAQRATRWYLTKKAIGRHRRLVATAVGALLLTLMLFAAITRQWRAAVTAEREKTEALAQAEADGQTARKTSEFLARLLSQVDSQEGRLSDQDFMEAVASIAPEVLGDEPVVLGEILRRVAKSFRSSRSLERAAEFAEAALAMHESALGPEHPQVVLDLQELAATRYRLEQRDVAESLIRRALELQARVMPDDLHRRALILNTLGSMIAPRRLDEAEAYFEEAARLMREHSDRPTQHISMPLGNLALIRRDRGDLAGSEALQRELLDLKRALGKNQHDIAYSHAMIAELRHRQSDFEGAIELQRESLRLAEEHFGTSDAPWSNWQNYFLGLYLEDAGRHDEAFDVLSTARERVCSDRGPTDPRCGWIHHVLATNERSLGLHDLAAEHHAVTLEIFRLRFGTCSAEYANALYESGRTELARGASDSARAFATEALDVLTSPGVENAKKLAEARELLDEIDQAVSHR